MIDANKTFSRLTKPFLGFLSFSNEEWFPGWQQNENYNRQPNEDGLSKQDCVEIRRYFHRPSISSATSASSLTKSFMWNDRDCATGNSFLCERPLIDGRFFQSCQILLISEIDQFF